MARAKKMTANELGIKEGYENYFEVVHSKIGYGVIFDPSGMARELGLVEGERRVWNDLGKHKVCVDCNCTEGWVVRDVIVKRVEMLEGKKGKTMISLYYELVEQKESWERGIKKAKFRWIHLVNGGYNFDVLYDLIDLMKGDNK